MSKSKKPPQRDIATLRRTKSRQIVREGIVKADREHFMNVYMNERAKLESILEEGSRIFQSAKDSFIHAYIRCLTAVLFADSPTFENKLDVLRTVFNKAYDGIYDAVRKIKTEQHKALYERYGELANERDYKVYDEMLSLMHNMGADLKTALSQALQDDITLLADLHERHEDKVMIDALKDYSEQIDTANIGLNTKINRATIHIGLKALELQHKNVKRISSQWRAIWRDLNGRNHTLTGDQRTAWEHLKGLGVQESLTREEERKIDQLIDSYKRAAKPYFDESRKSRQSHDSTLIF